MLKLYLQNLDVLDNLLQDDALPIESYAKQSSDRSVGTIAVRQTIDMLKLAEYELFYHRYVLSLSIRRLYASKKFGGSICHVQYKLKMLSRALSVYTNYFLHADLGTDLCMIQTCLGLQTARFADKLFSRIYRSNIHWIHGQKFTRRYKQKLLEDIHDLTLNVPELVYFWRVIRKFHTLKIN